MKNLAYIPTKTDRQKIYAEIEHHHYASKNNKQRTETTPIE